MIIDFDHRDDKEAVTMHKLVRRALEIAGSQEGVREVGGPNQGPQVNEYLKSVGLGPGARWCAAFVY
ncbi:MAG: hypothetical protein FJX78_02155 [Armatimonadetes bacterium]|nr:hypothetical protein [Armatimonadota bacterium]